MTREGNSAPISDIGCWRCPCVIGFAHELRCHVVAGGGDVSAGDYRTLPGSLRRDARSSSTASVAVSPRSRERRGSAKEPSWGRVLVTTIELWASRRLRHLGFLRGPV